MPTLPHAVSGERFTIDSPAGRISAYVAGNEKGKGPPLLLIHSVNAAASAAEVRPLHERYAATRTVFSIDLPGYGFSDRGDRAYTPRLMTDALHAIVAEIHLRCGSAPIDALATSLACEFLARAAVEAPQHFRSLSLVSPTGFRGGQQRREAAGGTLAKPWFLNTLRGPASMQWGGAVFRGLTRPAVIRYFLERTWGSKNIDETLWAYDVTTTRQPGAEFAPLHFLSGFMFSTDIHNIYEALTLPVWMSHGVRGDFTDYRAKTMVASRPNWIISVYETGAMPFFEVEEAFCRDFDAFLGRVAG